MAIGRQQLPAGQLRNLYLLGAIGDISDRQLLEQFTTGEADQAELAFVALVERHGPMVLRVCSVLLRNPHDAQDAFQATFLVLLRKARGLWIRESLGPWLHRVAERLAIQVQASARRRRAFERRAAQTKGAPLVEAQGIESTWSLLHQEIDRLPDRFRVPVILCHLEGQSHELAAKALNLPVGTVKSRLHRAHDILRGRLTRRGAAFSVALLTAEMAPKSVATAFSITLCTSLFRAAARTGTTQAGKCGLISLQTAHLVEEAIKTMFLTRLRIGAVAVMAGCLAIGAAGVFARQDTGQQTGQGAKSSASEKSQAVAASREQAPQHIQHSRKQIIERLERELAQARVRLDRTTRAVKSDTDPALLHARKTTDRLARLISRIDAVLVEAVDEFPTIFDFTNIEATPTAPQKPETAPVGKADVPAQFDVNISDPLTVSQKRHSSGQPQQPTHYPKNPPILPPARQTTNTR